MKKLLYLFLISFIGFPQNYVAQSNLDPISVLRPYNNSFDFNWTKREYADKKPQNAIVIKENSMNYNEIKAFVLTSIETIWPSKRISNKLNKSWIKTLSEEFSETPFRFIDGTSEHNRSWLQPIEGYIYFTLKRTFPDMKKTDRQNPNSDVLWIFKNHQKRTVFSFKTTNISTSEVLAIIGITTY